MCVAFKNMKLGLVAHTSNPSIREARVSPSLWIAVQPELHGDTLSGHRERWAGGGGRVP